MAKVEPPFPGRPEENVRLTLRGVLRGCGTLRATLVPAGGGAAALDDKRC